MGYVVLGDAILEHGPCGRESVALGAGDFVHVPPRSVHRVVNSSRGEWGS
ncbi:cupin domain-containing protein [Halorarum salinum]|uniref:Cupin domain-containing protein n=1 Tax=Halorarum salinum TaxID=2743089 RepID=A0A7D5LCE9_9EURY|nr:cupin domain-containing protein [Halobaculum salinum]